MGRDGLDIGSDARTRAGIKAGDRQDDRRRESHNRNVSETLCFANVFHGS
jgi:hypothetical protein